MIGRTAAQLRTCTFPGPPVLCAAICATCKEGFGMLDVEDIAYWCQVFHGSKPDHAHRQTVDPQGRVKSDIETVGHEHLVPFCLCCWKMRSSAAT